MASPTGANPSPAVSSARPIPTSAPPADSSPARARARWVLPTPASPVTSSTWVDPSRARCQARRTASRSASRPTRRSWGSAGRALAGSARAARSAATSSGPGSRPRCSTSTFRARWNTSSAVARRPAAVWARTRRAQRCSRYGSAATSASRSAVTSAGAVSSSSSARRSSTVSRSSTRRARSMTAGGQSSSSTKGRPRHHESACRSSDRIGGARVERRELRRVDVDAGQPVGVRGPLDAPRSEHPAEVGEEVLGGLVGRHRGIARPDRLGQRLECAEPAGGGEGSQQAAVASVERQHRPVRPRPLGPIRGPRPARAAA